VTSPSQMQHLKPTPPSVSFFSQPRVFLTFSSRLGMFDIFVCSVTPPVAFLFYPHVFLLLAPPFLSVIYAPVPLRRVFLSFVRIAFLPQTWFLPLVVPQVVYPGIVALVCGSISPPSLLLFQSVSPPPPHNLSSSFCLPFLLGSPAGFPCRL